MKNTRIIILAAVFLISALATKNGNAKIRHAFFPVIDNWKQPKKISTYNPGNLWDIINGAAENYISYQFEELLFGEYHNANNEYIAVEIYRHKNPVYAYGIYTQERPADADFLKIGTEGYQIESSLNFLTDRYYVKIRTHNQSDTVKTTIRELAKKIADAIGGVTTLPEVVGCFPEQGKINKSEQFIAKNFIGLEFLNDVFTARYKTSGKPFNLFVIACKNTGECKKLLKQYLKFANHEKKRPKQESYTIHDPYNGVVGLEWRQNYIFGIVNLTDKEKHASYLQKLKTNLQEKNLID